MSVYPEFLRSRDAQEGGSGWEVIEGPAARGEAWTDLCSRRMRVPFGAAAHHRLIRAHELMHARVSPSGGFDGLARDVGVEPRALECAEEYRVNLLLARLDFALEELRDGSERLSGRRLAESGDWDEAVWFCAALAGTRASKDLRSGVRSLRPDWARSLSQLEADLRRLTRSMPTSLVASTVPTDRAELGVERCTIAVARLVELHRSRGPSAPRRGRRPERTGEFAALVFDETVVLDRRVSGATSLVRRPASSGRAVRYPSRLVSDPRQRIFAGACRGRGGIVLVDQSGSMALRPEDLERLVQAAPGAYVMGYSHLPGSTGVANAWVLADRGRVASRIREGNVGNGVDGPALRHVLARRQGNERIVWVCDGQVTDSADHASAELAAQCARLCRRHGIHMVPGIDEAVEALLGRSGRPRLLGRVGAVTAPA